MDLIEQMRRIEESVKAAREALVRHCRSPRSERDDESFDASMLNRLLEMNVVVDNAERLLSDYNRSLEEKRARGPLDAEALREIAEIDDSFRSAKATFSNFMRKTRIAVTRAERANGVARESPRSGEEE
ncbi:uncharacterized protein LOC126852300 [Cataglyphis hispanica]|uniref:uncharacterized protein LOC126852300 n=1 Tax=Cataglyphis hispanica TaxID=1086592 RepID=UPI00217FB3AA|nr:uncharacterized protein LOC126852300 [Cataglyphis hispanica]